MLGEPVISRVRDWLGVREEAREKPDDGVGEAKADPGQGASTEAEWPAPLTPEAYYGLAGEIVAALEPHTESDPPHC
jgi:hypothetical protein